MSPDEAPGSPGEDQVRRVLAEAASADPARLPDDIAARLDRTLAELVAQRGPSAQPGPQPARRSWAGRRLLLAAAAVSVLGLGSAGVVTALQGQHGPTVTAGGEAGQASAPPNSGSAHAAGPKAAPSVAPPGLRPTGKQFGKAGQVRGAIPELRHGSLVRDVRRLLTHALRNGAATPNATQRELRSYRRSCAIPAHAGATQLFRVRYDGHPATLLVRPTRHGEHTAQVYSCHEAATPEAAVTVP
jgi:hypothetical protein